MISALPWTQDLPSLTALSLPSLLLWGRYRRLMRSESGGWGVAAVNLVLVLMNCRRKCLFQRLQHSSHSVAPFCHPHKHQPGLRGSFRALSLVAKPCFICLCPRPTSCIHARAHPKNLNKPLWTGAQICTLNGACNPTVLRILPLVAFSPKSPFLYPKQREQREAEERGTGY